MQSVSDLLGWVLGRRNSEGYQYPTLGATTRAPNWGPILGPQASDVWIAVGTANQSVTVSAKQQDTI